jgi:uncharacterized membrane protein (DUF373 family)
MEPASEPGGRSSPERRLQAVGERVVRVGEIVVVAAGGLLVLAAVILATGTLIVLFVAGASSGLGSIDSIPELQVAIQRVFAGVLLLMLGLELLETLKCYFTESQIRIEVILVVALIAVARHVMVLDVEHTNGAVLLGCAALVVGLAASYWLVRSRRERAA